MATIDATGKRSIHATLAASTVDTVTFTAAREIEVINVDGAAPIYFTVDATGSPTVAGDNTEVVPGVGSLVAPAAGDDNAVVKLISTGTPSYSVRIVKA